MFHSVSFYLLKNETKSHITISNGRQVGEVELQCAFQTMLWSSSENLRRCGILQQRLQKVPNWTLFLNLVLKPNGKEVDYLAVWGSVLEDLQDAMGYGVNGAGLKLKVSTYFSVQDTCTSLTLSTFNKAVMRPCYCDGVFEHIEYGTNDFTINREIEATFRDSHKASLFWKVSSISLWVEGIHFDQTIFPMSPIFPNLWINHRRLIFDHYLHIDQSGSDTEVDSDIENEPRNENRCFFTTCKALICALRPVIIAMDNGEDYLEQVREILHMRRDTTNTRVLAVLRFLHSGDLQEPSENSSLAVCLFRVGHYYSLKVVKEAMKVMMVTRPIETFNAHHGQHLLRIANLNLDYGLRIFANDILRNVRRLRSQNRRLR